MVRDYIKQDSDKVFWLVTLLIGGIGALIIFYTTVWGPGLLDWDSFNYVAGAQNLASGHGYILPIDTNTNFPLTHFPPGLSFILAVFNKLGANVISSARYLNIFLFSANTILLILVVRKVIGSIYFGFIAGVIFISFAPMIEAHTWLLSEPLFLFCSILSFYLLVSYLEKPTPGILIALSVFLGYSFFTRYVGLANLITAGIFLWVSNKNDAVKRRIIDLGCVYLISGLPTIAFTIFNYYETHKLNNRELGWHPLNINNLVNAFHTFYEWFLPEALVVGFEKLHVFLLFAIIMVMTLISFIYGYTASGNIFYLYRGLVNIPLTLRLYCVYFLVYIGVVFLAKTFADPNIGMSDRIFLPDYFAFVVLTTGVGGLFWSMSTKTGYRILIGLLMGYLLFYNITISFHSVQLLHDRGLGLGRKAFYNSRGIQELKMLSDKSTIFSNYGYALYLHTGQIGYPLGAFDNFKDDVSHQATVAIFTFRLDNTHPFIEKNKDELELIIRDDIVSVYSVKP